MLIWEQHSPVAAFQVMPDVRRLPESKEPGKKPAIESADFGFGESAFVLPGPSKPVPVTSSKVLSGEGIDMTEAGKSISLRDSFPTKGKPPPGRVSPVASNSTDHQAVLQSRAGSCSDFAPALMPWVWLQGMQPRLRQSQRL